VACTRTYVGSVERGERNVTVGTIEAISKALGVPLPFFSRTKLMRAGSTINPQKYTNAIRSSGLTI